MNRETVLSGLKRLSEVRSMKDIRSLTHAMFPGTHCPLLGAILAARGIHDSLVMVVGTDECAYYAKNFTIHSESFGGLSGRCVSVALDRHDVTFGGMDKVSAAFKEVMSDYCPACVFLVSTCIVEIIGDDIDSLAESLSMEYGVPVMPVHTEHFKCEDHLPGIERAVTACIELMEAYDVPDGSVNILGQRMGNFEDTELFRVLLGENIPIGLQLPGACKFDDIRKAAMASVNIVVNSTALPLAEKMQKRFQTPYVYFDKFADPETIRGAYHLLFDYLKKPLPSELSDLYRQACRAVDLATPVVEGMSYVYGASAFLPYEHNRMMCCMGMMPKLLQLSRLSDDDASDIRVILNYHDPYVTRSANVSALETVYDALHPDLSFGPAYPNILQKKGITPVRYEGVNSMLGFELATLFADGLRHASEMVRAIRENM